MTQRESKSEAGRFNSNRISLIILNVDNLNTTIWKGECDWSRNREEKVY